MITFNNAGVALGRFVNNMNKSRGYAATHVRFVQNVLAIFPHLFSGLAQLGSSFDRQRDFVHRLFYTHMDLNQGNILVKELTTGELEGRMIDFGFSMNIGRLIDVTPFRLQIRDHPRSRSHRRENYYVFTPPDFDVFNLVVGDPKQYGLIVEDCKYTRLVRFVYTRKSMVSNSLVLPQLADVRDLANYLSDEIGRDRTLDFRTAIQTFKNLRSTSSVSPYMLMPWNKVDVYQIGLNGLISSLDMLNMIRETYTISRRDEVEGYYTAINNACKVFRRCVTWNVFERLTANQARDELLSAARE